MTDDVDRCPSTFTQLPLVGAVPVVFACSKAAGHLGVHAWHQVTDDVRASLVWWTEKRRGAR